MSIRDKFCDHSAENLLETDEEQMNRVSKFRFKKKIIDEGRSSSDTLQDDFVYYFYCVRKHVNSSPIIALIPFLES